MQDRIEQLENELDSSRERIRLLASEQQRLEDLNHDTLIELVDLRRRRQADLRSAA